MCGIVCYKGKENAQNIILNGLRRLEYRGYDSAGMATVQNGKIHLRKRKGRLGALEETLQNDPLPGNTGIGHIRWATHGPATEENAHPHLSENGKIAVVHNGIIENYSEHKERLTKEGYPFASATDTEVISALLQQAYEGDILEAFKKVRTQLEGSYALGILCADEDDRLIAARMESPLILGIVDNGYILASDIPSLLHYTREVIYLENGDTVDIQADRCTVYDKNFEAVDRPSTHIDWSVEDAGKEGFDHFMIKEIHEQPKAVKELLRMATKEDHIVIEDNWTKEELHDIHRIYIVGCGTAFNAGVVGRRAIEKLCRIPVITEIASEFRYGDPFLDERTLVIFISQSGETADVIAALRLAKDRGAKTLAVTNVVGSSVAREADKVMYCHAGPEIAVASTKAYTTQVVALYLYAYHMALTLGRIEDTDIREFLNALKQIPEKIERILKQADRIQNIAEHIKDAHSIFYIGRGNDYATVEEGALKLKEVSYIHTEAFAAGELKHGTLALIEEKTPVVAIVTDAKVKEKTLSNIEEVISRGGRIVLIETEKTDASHAIAAEDQFVLPATEDALYPVLSIIVLQLLAYYTARAKEIDPDKPRNLAKSVTVE